MITAPQAEVLAELARRVQVGQPFRAYRVFPPSEANSKKYRCRLSWLARKGVLGKAPGARLVLTEAALAALDEFRSAPAAQPAPRAEPTEGFKAARLRAVALRQEGLGGDLLGRRACWKCGARVAAERCEGCGAEQVANAADVQE